ncbi:MAG: O-antigen ligase family protein, partial [Thermoleophilia bacterium]
LLMIGGVATGLAVRPLSALREFTVSYLGLVIVPYVALFVRSRRDISRVFIGVALVGVGAPLVLLPLVGELKGWGIGPETRFYPSTVHMGIVYGLLCLYLLWARGRAWRLVFAVVLIPSVFLIVVDSHRSVWLAISVSLVVLTVTGRIRLERFWKWGFVVVLVAVLAGTALAALGRDPIGYVASRSVAFSDPNADATSAWRLALWEGAIRQGRQHLVLGEGFGSYYGFRTSLGTITVSPHSLYVQTFLKVGLSGLLTYVALTAVVIAALASAWRRARRPGDRQMEPVLLMGLAAAWASVAYSLVYSFEVYSMLFVGIGLAAALRAADRSAASRAAR